MSRLQPFWWPALAIAISIAVLASVVWLQLKPTMVASHGGFYQYTSRRSHGWPRRNALCRVEEHKLNVDSGVPLTFSTTTTNSWNISDSVVNFGVCAVIVVSTVFSLTILIRRKRPIQFNLKTLLLASSVAWTTIVLYVNEYAIHQMFCQSDSFLLDFELHALHSLRFYELIPILAGIALTVWAVLLLVGNFVGRVAMHATKAILLRRITR